MRKFCLFLFLLSASGVVFSQTQINLTFEAKDSQSLNPLTLESIYIKNVTEDCDTSFPNESIYNSVSWIIPNAIWPVGINEIYAGGKGSIMMNQNSPNPFQGETKVNIYKQKKGPLSLILTDELGRTLVSYQSEFEKGYHSFNISASIHGVLVLSVTDGQEMKSIKIINTATGQGLARNSILYLGKTAGFENRNYKSSENSGFSFYLGNEMTFTAFISGYLEQTITDNPTSDSTYTFYMTLSNLPEVETSPVTGITQSTAQSGGNVITDGGEPVTARGICWNTTGWPTTDDSFTVDGDGTGYFTSGLSGLTPDTRYYVCAYATNNSGTVYGNDVTFKTSTPLPETEAAINDTLLNCYSKLYDYNELLYLFDAVYSNDVPAPDASWNEIFNHSHSSDNEKIYLLWANAFDIIYKTNLIIQSSEIVITDQPTKDKIIAQAKAIRAYLYYNLVNWFGEVPIEPGTAESVIPRNTVTEVLAQIMQDATESFQLLPMSWSVPDNFRIPKFFAKALLSRAYLYSNDYSAALNPTQEIINSSMYALSADPNNFTSAGTEIFWGFEKRNNTEFNTFFNKGSFVPVIRYTESFLVEAEALFNTGNQASALNYINMLNSRRGLPTISSLTSEALFQHWNTELVKEGNMFSTLKRFGKALTIVQNYPHKLLLPVPMSFIISNVNLTQNIGY